METHKFEPYLISLSCDYCLWVDDVVRPIQKAVFDATKTGIIDQYLADLLEKHKECARNFDDAMSNMATLKSAIDSPSPYASLGFLGAIAHREYMNGLGSNMNVSRWEVVLDLVRAEGLLDHIAEKHNYPRPRPSWTVAVTDWKPLLSKSAIELIADFKTAVAALLGEDFGQAIQFTRNGAWWNRRMPYRCLDSKVRFLGNGYRAYRKSGIAVATIRWQRTEPVK